MRVNLPAHNLSHTVPAGIYTLCTLNYLPGDSTTAGFIETVYQMLLLLTGHV